MSFVELGSCRVVSLCLSGQCPLEGQPLRLCGCVQGGASLWSEQRWGCPAGAVGSEGPIHLPPVDPKHSLEPLFLPPPQQRQTCLLLLLFTCSSPHPICLSLLLPPLLSPSLFHLPLIPCKRLIILTGSAMAFIFLRQPRDVCEHLL